MTATDRRPLATLRVIDSTDEHGDLASRLLADLGADVVKVEPPGGSSARSLPPLARDGTSLSFALRNTNKRGIVADLADPAGRAELERLLAGADVWIESHRAGHLEALGIERAGLLERFGRLTIVTITDFGLDGPYRDFVATNDVMTALGGLLARSGEVGRPPLLPPGLLAYDTASVMGAFAALASIWQRRTTGRGQHIDLSVMQATAQISDWSLPNYSAITAAGGVYQMIRTGSRPVYPLYPCADGHVRLIMLSKRQWRAMRDWLGDPEILQDDHWDTLPARMSIQEDVLDPLFVELFRDRTSAELADEAQRRGIVMTPVLSPAQVLATDHYAQRATFVDGEVAAGVRGPVPTGFVEIDGRRAGYTRRSPSLGEHTAEVAAETAVKSAAPSAASAPALPFAGLHVLDLGHGGVGVETGRLFAEYGADVIKVETSTYPDFIRQVFGGNMSASFASSSRSKRSLGVNVKVPSGLALLERLVEWADVLIENTSTGTMADMGTSYEVLHQVNPRLVMASSQLMGTAGPWSSWIGYGPSTRGPGGMTYLWNYADGGMPPGSGAIHPDHLVGRLAAVAALACLVGREAGDGTGAHVEAAQVETLINTLGDYFLQESLAPASARPQGNRRPTGTPWGVYPCAGVERWVVITVRNDDEWRALRGALGDPPWASTADYTTAAGRLAAADTIDAELAAWTAERTDHEVMAALQAVGVPAGAMLYASDTAADPQLAARNYLRTVDQPPYGTITLEGQSFTASGMPEPLVFNAPALGEHTREICQQILGMTDGEIDALIAEGALEEPSS